MSKHNTKNTATIQDMIEKKIVNVGDGIQFTFKGNTFYAKILRGGLIGDCRMSKTYSKEVVLLDRFVSAFSSLTAWTEAMLQDVLEEYYTRYSSWKRVTHSSTKRTMSDLRDLCKIHLKNYRKEENIELFKEILYLHDMIKKLTSDTDIKTRQDLFSKDLYLHRQKPSENMLRKKPKKRRKVTVISRKAQDMMLKEN